MKATENRKGIVVDKKTLLVGFLIGVTCCLSLVLVGCPSGLGGGITLERVLEHRYGYSDPFNYVYVYQDGAFIFKVYCQEDWEFNP